MADVHRSNARVAAALAIAVVVLTAVGAALYLRAREQMAGAPERVLVVPFYNANGDSALASFGRTASDRIAAELTRTGLVDVVTDSTIPAGPGDAALRAAATRHAAASVLSGTYYVGRDSIRAEARLFDAPSWKVRADAIPASVPRSSPEMLLDSLRRRSIAMMAAVQDRRFADWLDRRP